MAYQDKKDETVPRGGGNVSGKSAVELPKGGGNISGKGPTDSTESMQAQSTNTTPSEDESKPQPRTISDKS